MQQLVECTKYLKFRPVQVSTRKFILSRRGSQSAVNMPD